MFGLPEVSQAPYIEYALQPWPLAVRMLTFDLDTNHLATLPLAGLDTGSSLDMVE